MVKFAPNFCENCSGSCGRPHNLSGRWPELVRELPGIEWPGPGISLGDAQNNQNWSGSF